jgi:hypothetical protein
MKTKLLAMLVLAGGSMFAQTRFSVGVNVGGYGAGYDQLAAPYYATSIPPCPGPDYSWIDGYWSENGGRRLWVNGYWFRGGHDVGRFDNSGFRGEVRGGERGFVQDRGFRDDRNQGRNFSSGQNRGGDNRGGQNRGDQNQGGQNRGSERQSQGNNRGSGNQSRGR